jgi:methionyl-tRNA formyltransferase
MIQVVFMGTPDFAVPSLSWLASSSEYTIAGVYTQPDKPAGRGHKLLAPPVKAFAAARDLVLFQPRTLRSSEALADLIALHPDVIVVAAFGLILPRPVLDLPPHGCINVHASLLPRYRGAAPIAAAILNGESVAGVTIMQIDEGVDTGPMLAQAELPVRPDDTAGTLTARLALLGADLLAQTLPGWLAGQVNPQAQDDAQATIAPRLNKEDGHMDWSLPASVLERRVRAFELWPGTFTAWNGKRLKINKARISDFKSQISDLAGQVVGWESGVGVITGEGVLELIQVQLEGKRAMSAIDFVRGHPDFIGAQLGQLGGHGG